MKRILLSLSMLLLLSLSAGAQKTKIKIETDSGTIIISLYDGTPLHRDNMVKLVKQKFYDGLLWHRVIPNFVIQGGDPKSKGAAPGVALGDGDVGYRVPAEIKDEYYHVSRAVGMARDNNPEKASSGCQFYIVTGRPISDQDLDAIEQRTQRKYTAAQREAYKKLGGVPFLDGGYTVFGEVTEGMDVVERISKTPTSKEPRERPVVDIHMTKVTVYKKKHFWIF
jgi:cyclophilin family peptidyl-prolyl cis-trans isomerase